RHEFGGSHGGDDKAHGTYPEQRGTARHDEQIAVRFKPSPPQSRANARLCVFQRHRLPYAAHPEKGNRRAIKKKSAMKSHFRVISSGRHAARSHIVTRFTVPLRMRPGERVAMHPKPT